MGLIVAETNKHEENLTRWHDRTIPAHQRRWTKVTIPELYVFFALTMLMAHVKKHTIQDYWIVPTDITATPVFSKYMSRDRYKAILSCLHLVNNYAVRERDRLWKIRPLYMMLRRRFAKFFKPFRNVVIDESLVLFRGRLMFRQYIPAKRHRWGIKYFVLCDCKSGYVLDFMIYSGKGEAVEEPGLGKTGTVVKILLEDYFGKGHVLYTDNFYTSPALSRFLLRHDTGTVGTVKLSRHGMPKETCPLNWPPKKEIKKGDLLLRKSEGPILATLWKDKRKVSLLSTIHKGQWKDTGKVSRRTGEPIKKPDAVLDYNINMRLVDKGDMMLSFIDCLRKSYKWYKKFILHSIDMSVVNAYYLYTFLNPDPATRQWKSLRLFQKQILEELLQKYSGRQDTPIPRQMPPRDDANEERLSCAQYLKRHKLVIIPPDSHQRAGDTRGRRRCRVCTGTTLRPRQPNKKTSYQCHHCQVPLCPDPCFNVYHTENVY